MEDWIVRMDKQAQQQRSANTPETIQITGNGKPFYRVTEYARQGQHSSLYVPWKTSIGPYHNATLSCEQGEREKEQCLLNFLSRSRTLQLRGIIDSLFEIVDEVRDMYDGLDDRWVGEDKKEAFLRMMVVDGCYLLEIMMEAMESQGYGKPRPHPVFNHNEMETYRHDMLVLDNQIPLKLLVPIWEKSKFFSGSVLEALLGAFNDYKPIFSAGRLNDKKIMQLFETIDKAASMSGALTYLTKDFGDSNENEGKPYHFLVLLIHGFFSLSGDGELEGQSNDSSACLLGVYRWGLLGGKTYTNSPIGYSFLVSSFYDSLPSATQIEEAKIGIRPSLHGYQIDVSFNKRTGLVLQRIAIDRATRSNFHNTVLYERLHPSENYHFSSYIYFMHCLLKDAADSRLLRARNILNTTMGDEEVIDLFNELGKSISFHSEKPMDKRIWKVGVELSQRFNKNMQTWRKDLFQKYLNSPWAYVSILVAFLIFTCTAFQTIYTILGYYRGN